MPCRRVLIWHISLKWALFIIELQLFIDIAQTLYSALGGIHKWWRWKNLSWPIGFTLKTFVGNSQLFLNVFSHVAYKKTLTAQYSLTSSTEIEWAPFFLVSWAFSIISLIIESSVRAWKMLVQLGFLGSSATLSCSLLPCQMNSPSVTTLNPFSSTLLWASFGAVFCFLHSCNTFATVNVCFSPFLHLHSLCTLMFCAIYTRKSKQNLL